MPLAFQGHLSWIHSWSSCDYSGSFIPEETFSVFTRPSLMFHLSLAWGIAAFPEELALTLSVGAQPSPSTSRQGEAEAEGTPRKAWDTLVAFFGF